MASLFFGEKVTNEAPVCLESSSGDLIHVSKLVLTSLPTNVKGGDNIYYSFNVIQGGKQFTVALLNKDIRQVDVDIFLPSGTEVRLVGGKGKAEVDITGYCDPLASVPGMDDSDEEGQSSGSENEAHVEESVSEGEESDNDSGEEEQDQIWQKSAVAAMKNVKVHAADEASNQEESEEEEGSSEEEADEEEASENEEEVQTKALKAATPSSDEEQEEEDSSAGESEDEQEEQAKAKKMMMDSDEDGEEESSSDEEQVVVTKKNVPPPKKRKADFEPAGATTSKKPAVETPDSLYETEIISFLKKSGGSAKISFIGAKVRRPAAFKNKLSPWLKERDAFVVVGDLVKLKK